MGLLDPTLFGNLNKLKGLLGETPIGKYLRGQDQGVSVNGLKQALLGMPVFDQRAGEQDMAYAADAIGPQVMGLVGKIVYHGSPHKFDKFDASKIGTGEGAQAYGHGVYLADSEGVAQSYKAALGAGRGVGDADTMARVLDAVGGDAAKAADVLRRRAQHANIPGGKERLLSMADQVAAGVDPRGSLYKADLPDEWIPKMLDWDNSIPEEMRQRISKPMMEKFGSGASGGQGLNQWKQVVWEFKNAGSKQPEVDAANFLREQGVTGIRYLDGGSRGKGQGSYNYVVFPGLEDKVKILERNGIPINDGLLGRK